MKGLATLDQLISMVTERAGISTDQAQTAITTVLGFIKDRLPGPIASQVENVLGGNMGNMGNQAQPNVGNVGDQLGGMFGGNR